jgi:transposase
MERESGIRYRPGHIWNILRQVGWSCQRSAGRALERNEAAMLHSMKQRRPELKKKPKKKGEQSSSTLKAD